MEPIEFDEANALLGKEQSEYKPLPALVKNDSVGEIVTCWTLSPADLETVNKTGVIWLSQWTFGKPPMPVRLTTQKDELI